MAMAIPIPIAILIGSPSFAIAIAIAIDSRFTTPDPLAAAAAFRPKQLLDIVPLRGIVR
jgi:hypothetical protein